MPRGKHPRCAWPSPHQQSRSPVKGDWRRWCYRWEVLTPGRAARPDPGCRQASTFPREQDAAQLCCSPRAPQLSQPAGRICSRAKGKQQHSSEGRERHFCSQRPFPRVLTPLSPRRGAPGQAGVCSVDATWGTARLRAALIRARAAAAQKLPFPWGKYPGVAASPLPAQAAQIQPQGTGRPFFVKQTVETPRKSILFPPSQGSSYTSRWSPGLSSVFTPSISDKQSSTQNSWQTPPLGDSSLRLIPPIPELTFQSY